MKLKLSLLVLLCPFFCLHGQPVTHPPGVQVGDKVPDLILRGLVNYNASGVPATTAKLADFERGLLIIDFWNTYCPPCVGALPRYDSLQQQFEGKLQILLVTNEKKAKVEAFFRLHVLHLPSLTDDTLLTKLFPHTSVPHEVWIQNGKVAAITFGEDVNARSIYSILSKTTAPTEQKKDNLNFDPLQPLLINGNGGNGTVLYQSLITPYIPGLTTVAGFQQTAERLIAVGINTSLIALYMQAFSHHDPLLELPNRYEIDLPDSIAACLQRGKGVPMHEWFKKYGICYSLVLPPDFKGDISEAMVTDLNRYCLGRYQVSVSLVKKQMNCLVLSRIPGTSSLISSGTDTAFKATTDHYQIKNLPVGILVMELAQRYKNLPTPIVDDTGYNRAVAITLDGDLSDMTTLCKQLKKSGLSLTLQKRTIEMVVLSMRKTSPAALSANPN